MTHAKVVVLVVEDEPLVRLGIVDYLEDKGFSVLEASTASEAITILTTDLSVQILFTDIDMPGDMDGLKLAAAVRDRWPPIRIVVTSGHRNIDVRDLPEEARFFPKPYRPEIIASTMRLMASSLH